VQAGVAAELRMGCWEIENLQRVGLDQLDGTGQKRYYAGYDVGRRKDLSVLWVLEKIGDVFWSRIYQPIPRMNFTAQEDLLNRLMANKSVRRICIDETGLGMMLAERQQQKWGYRAEPVTFTPASKGEMGMPLVRLFEDKLIRIPALDEVRSDIHSMRKIVTAAGNVRLDADRDESGHADRFWALALAYHAADDLKLPLPAPLARKPVGW
jgi:phage FluMu gp28-like protein